MRKSFTSLLVLAAMLAGTTTAWAQLYVNGVEVITTGTEIETITGPGISGSVKYYPWAKVLMLEDATITTSGNHDGIYNSAIEGLSISFKGTVKITTSSSGANMAGIYCTKRTYLTRTAGTHTPTVTVSNTGSGPAIISTEGADIEFFGINATVTASNNHAICTHAPAKLIVYASTLTASTNSSRHYAITGFKSGLRTIFDRCPLAVFDNNSHSFDETTGSVVCNGKPVQSTTFYPAIKIGDEALSYQTPEIKTTTTGASSVSGSVRFNPNANPWLELEDFSMKGKSIVCRIPNLEVRIKGSNTITTTKTNVANIYIYANTTFTGDGSLTLSTTGTDVSAISTYNDADVTVEINDLTVQGTYYGFYGQPNGTLTLKRYSDSSIYKFLGTKCNVYTGKLVMDDMDIWTQNSYFHTGEHKMWRSDKDDVAHGTNMSADCTVFKTTSEFSYFPIWVGGTHVSERNCNDIHSPYITEGKVSYSSGRRTLTLTDVQFEATGTDAPNGIYVGTGLDGLTLNFSGADQHWTTDNNVLDFGSMTNITGNCERIYLTSNKKSGIYSEASVSINTSGFFGAKGAKHGYYGNHTTNEVLTLSKTSSDTYDYTFEGAEGAIYNVTSLKLNNMDFGYQDGLDYLPGCYFEESRHYVAQNGGLEAKGKVSFASIKEQLPISVAGKKLNRLYADTSVPIYVGSHYITSDPKSVMYVPATKTLTFTDATIDDTNVSNVVHNEGIDKLNINMAGDNNFKVTDNVFLLDRTTTISGTGTVKGELYADDGFGIYLSSNVNDNLVLDGPTFKFKGQEAIGGVGTNNVTINSPLTFEPNDYAISALYKLNSVTFGEGLDITYPQGAYYSTSLEAVTTDGETRYSGKLVIDQPTTSYPLTIAGVTVSSTNCADILHDGVFSYNPRTKTLTINGDCTYSGWIVDSEIDGLTINVSDNSTLTQKSSSSILRLWNTTTITGGKLTLKSETAGNRTFGIYISGGRSLTICDACIEVEGDGFCYGITGEEDVSLMIDNSDITVSAHGNGCIHGWRNITLTNCFVEQPSESIIKPYGIYSTEDHIIGSGEETETLVIIAGEPTPIIRGDVNRDSEINTADAAAVYVYIIKGEQSNFTKEDANVNGDNDINSADVVAIYNIIISGSSDSKKVYEKLLEMGE